MAGSGASQIQKPCDTCKRYLDHLDGKNENVRSFLRPMTACSKHGMVVPKRFLKHFAGKLSGIIKLESPNRGSYDVEVTEHCNEVVFQHGWGQFVESLHIEGNDYLLFRHVERSCFEVLIFDSDGCEKVFSCAGIRNVDYGDISSNSHCATTESSASERFVRCQKGSSCDHGKIAKMAATFSSFEESGEDIPSENKSVESDDLQAPLRQGYILSQRSNLSKAQEERVIAFIQEIQPESTAFVAVIRKSHVEPTCPYLVIPKEYAFAHFPHESTNVTLQSPGNSKKWHPKFYKRKDGKMYTLRGKWMDFVHDNHVQEGDICLFLPTIAGRRSTFTVYLIHSTSTSRGGSGKRGCLSCRKETAKKAATSSLYEESGEDSLSGHESIQSDHVKAFSESNYVLSARCHLTAEQEEKIVALVKKVQPEIPFLVIQMKKSNVNRLRSNLVICKGYAAEHFPQKGQFITLERPGGKKWRSRLHVRPDGRAYILTARWQNFVRDNQLRKDDICLFQPMPSEKGFRVMVHLLCEPSTRSSSSGGHVHGLNSHIKRGVTSTAHVHEKSGSERESLSCQKETAKKARTSSLYEESGEGSLCGYESIQSDHVKANSERYYVLSAQCHLTAEQKEKIVALVKKVQPEIPVLVVKMKKSNVKRLNSNLVICKGYAAQHFPQESQYITLECPGGKKWRPKLHVRPDGRGYMLSTRWQNFVRDNCLREDDICLFQPIPIEKGFRVVVHLLRARSTCSSSLDGHAHGLHSHIKRGLTSTVHVHEKSGSKNSETLDLQKRRAVQQGPHVLSDCGGPSSFKPPLYVVLGGTCLTPAQDKVVQEKAMAIKAELFIFVATMNKKILGYNNEAFILDFSDADEYLPDGNQSLTLRWQGQGRAWRTDLHNRLMLATGEWREFVHDSGLEDGDICLFEPMKNERLAMLVHIVRSQQYS